MNELIVHPDVNLLAAGFGLVQPLLVGLGTRLNARPAVKATFNAVLTVVSGVVATAIASPEVGIPVGQAAYAVVFAFVSSVATYHSLWKPIGATGAIQNNTPEIGLG